MFGDTSDLEREDGCAIAVGMSDADAQRLAACWNACLGFDTDAIENILVVGDTFKARFGMLQSENRETLDERDQLRTDLAEAIALLRENLDLPPGSQVDSVQYLGKRLIKVADLFGVVVTISQSPRLPLAMGNYDTVVSVREAQAIYKPRLAAEAAAKAAAQGGAE